MFPYTPIDWCTDYITWFCQIDFFPSLLKEISKRTCYRIPHFFPSVRWYESYSCIISMAKQTDWLSCNCMWEVFALILQQIIYMIQTTTGTEFSVYTVWYDVKEPLTVAARSKAWVCGRWLAGIAGSKPAEARMSLSFECRLLSGRGLYVGLITRPEEACRVRCVCVWSWSLDNGLNEGKPETCRRDTLKGPRRRWYQNGS